MFRVVDSIAGTQSHSRLFEFTALNRACVMSYWYRVETVTTALRHNICVAMQSSLLVRMCPRQFHLISS